MSVPEPTLERATVERVAQEYREKGYEDAVGSAVSELPDFVREFRPDIIARSSNDCVVIEVKNWVSAADRERLRAIAS
jgi:Holliday junction resolvase